MIVAQVFTQVQVLLCSASSEPPLPQIPIYSPPSQSSDAFIPDTDVIISINAHRFRRQGGSLGEIRPEIQSVTVLCLEDLHILIAPISSATEAFDHLCFEFGIELDEDVRSQ